MANGREMLMAARGAMIHKMLPKYISYNGSEIDVINCETKQGDNVTSIENDVWFTNIFNDTRYRRSIFGWGALHTNYIDIEKTGKLGQGVDSIAQIDHSIETGVEYHAKVIQLSHKQTILLYIDDVFIGSNEYSSYSGFDGRSLGLFYWGNGVDGYLDNSSYGRGIGIRKYTARMNGVLVFDGIAKEINGCGCIYDSVSDKYLFGKKSRSSFVATY